LVADLVGAELADSIQALLAWKAFVIVARGTSHGALALGLNAWLPFAGESMLTAGLAWVLFSKPEPVIQGLLFAERNGDGAP
jgi:hypothetical protein